MEPLIEKIKLIEKSVKNYKNIFAKVEKNLGLISKRVNEIEEKPFLFHEIIRNLKKDMQLTAQYFNQDDFNLIDELAREVEKNKEIFTKKIGDELDRRCSEIGVKISGKFPDLKAGFFTLSFEFLEGVVKLWFGPKIELLGDTKLDINKIMALINNEIDSIKSKKPDDDEFLRDLFKAYSNLIKKKNIEMGQTLSLTDVLVELSYLKQNDKFYSNPKREHFLSYSRSQFAYNLYSLKKREIGSKKLKIEVATREHTKSPRENIWIPTNERGDGVHFSHLAFVE